MRSFEDLAAMCIQEKNPAELESLIAAHRVAYADGGDLPVWNAELRWLKKDYEGVLTLLEANREEAFALPRNKTTYDNLLVRSLLKLDRIDEAVRQADLIGRRKLSNRVLVVLAHAATGDAKQTIAATAKLGPPRYLLWDCYHDEDLGPMLRGDAFREFRERFPEPRERYGRFGVYPIDD